MTLPPTIAQQSVQLAAKILHESTKQQKPPEERQAAKISRMMEDNSGKLLTLLLADQAFRSENPKRIADQISYLQQTYGTPQYFEQWEQIAFGVGAYMGQYLPALVIPFIVAQLRKETSNVILPAEEQQFQQFLQKRQADNIRLNVNQLGEAILGEGEAKRRLEKYLRLLENPNIEYISIKISSIFSQINLIAFDQTVEKIKDRLRVLYRHAMQHLYHGQPKFINLDMEEYRDLHLTIAAFQQVLDEPEFMSLKAGIVLQAYLPDSAQAQRDLVAWATARVKRGGAPIKLRIVKGANLAMERVEAALQGWEQAPYLTKSEVDANFKRMVTYGCKPEHAKVVNLGIASHNLFDVSYALLLRNDMDIKNYVEFEMLEGMANHQARAVQAESDGLLLYAPIVTQDDFHSAIAYLVRRLDENTAPENFLHDLFDMEVDSPKWIKQRDLFLDAIEKIETVSDQPNRQQNRLTEEIKFDPKSPFHNEPDTDFALRQNQQWIVNIRDKWQTANIENIPLQINHEFHHTTKIGDGVNPAIPHDIAYQYALANHEQINTALDTAKQAQPTWHARSDRKELLVDTAEIVANRRGDFIGVMMIDAAKTVEQADVEISEAIDFCNYYARSFDKMLDGVQQSALGVVLVTPPWNFPLAIPMGGVVAALMAGNSVILKPAPETVLVAWHLVNALWDAGIPKDVLQFVPTTDDDIGKSLVTDDRVNAVILTGAYDTARLFLGWNPNLHLLAETSGKNALIITAMSDRDQAIKDLVKSAFGHAGQKCSASSLAILEAEVYDDPTFRRQLKDAAQSLVVGYADNLASQMTTIIRPPDPTLQRGLTQLDDDEEWLLKPQQLAENPNLWTPGIRLNVSQGSFFHHTECFGPVLGLMRADNLAQAIHIANDSHFGLTGGIHSLDDREIDIWQDKIEVGNAYINRSITGAIVQRQPFGGWKKSAFGYSKAGGCNYTYALSQWQDTTDDPHTLLEVARTSYPNAWKTHFSLDHDPSQVLGESNIFRYRPLKRIIFRVTSQTTEIDIQRIILAVKQCNTTLRISMEQGVTLPKDIDLTDITIKEESTEELIEAIQDTNYQYAQRLRITTPISEAVRLATIDAHVMITSSPVVSNGRLELRHYVQEQSVTQTLHRYGNILR